MVTVAAAGMLAGCDVFDPSLLDGGPGGQPSCDLETPPPRPDTEDGPSRDEPLVFALRGVVLNQDNDRWREIGYDLDERCTTSPDAGVGCVPPTDDVDPKVDGVGGTDNVFGQSFFPLVQAVLPGFEDESREALAQGQGTFLVQTTQWNGKLTDPQITVSIMQAVDGTPCEDGTAPDVTFEDGKAILPNGSAAPPPSWEPGQDCWWARKDDFVLGNPDQPKIVDSSAYMVDGEVVVNLPDGMEVLFFAGDQGVLVRLTDGVSTAILEDTEDYDRLGTTTVAGRWAITNIRAGANTSGVCAGTRTQETLDTQLNRIADVRSTPGTGGTNIDCDAISLGVEFKEGVRGKIAGLAPGPSLPNPCADAGMGDAGSSSGSSSSGSSSSGSQDVMDAGMPDGS